MGFARLAYGLLVPAMRHAIGGDLATYGAIGTWNFVGYLVGTLLATRFAKRTDRARIDIAFLLATAATLFLSGVAHDPLFLGVIRFLAGVTSGVALSLTLALATEQVPPARRGLAAAIIWAGGSAGVALVGFGSLFVRADDPTGWRIEWIGMAVAGALLAFAFSRSVGGRFVRAEQHDDGAPMGLFARDRYLWLAIAYFCYGFGYIDILTFLGATLANAAGVAPGAVWIVLGLAGAAGATLWGPLVDRFRNGVPIAIAASTCAAGTLLCATRLPVPAIIGAFAIGISFIGVPAMVGALVQQREKPGNYPRGFASITSTLGVGQILGPLTGGFLADAAGAPAALVMGAAMLGVAVAFALAYRPARVSPVT